MLNNNKLRGKIVENGMTINELAEAIGISHNTFYKRLRADGATFTVFEIQNIAKTLHLTIDDVNSIFYSSIE